MKVRSEELKNFLKTQSSNLFLVYGSEILLVNESIEHIKTFSKKLGFNDLVRFDINASFDWNTVFNELSETSLFSSHKLIMLNLGNAKIGVKGSNAIDEITQSIPDNIHIILTAEKLERTQLNSKWFKSVDKNGVVIAHYSVEISQLLNWTIQKLNSLGIQNNQRIAELIAVNTEGNLLATDQEIKKIALAYPSGEIDLDEYKKYITEQSKYSIFNLIDSSFLGKSSQVIKIFKTLADESSFPVILSSSLYRELNNLINMSIDMRMGKSLEEVYQSHGVWSYKKNIIKTALLKHSFQHLQKFLMRLSRVDRAIKGRDNTPVLEELESILLGLSGVKNVS
jgi:DNA polymerase-3 subunit delta